MAHGQAIMATQGDVEFHHVYKVEVCGDDLGSQYMDIFVRT